MHSVGKPRLRVTDVVASLQFLLLRNSIKVSRLCAGLHVRWPNQQTYKTKMTFNDYQKRTFMRPPLSQASHKHKDKIIIKQPTTKTIPVVEVWRNMTVKELSVICDRSLDDVFEAMLYVPNSDAYDTPNTQIDDLQIIREIGKKLGVKMKTISAPDSAKASENKGLIELKPRPVNEKYLAPRPPVVAIMGHVDHGKTTLLDYIRSSSIVSSEAGGITQHIGAFVVTTEDGNSITFLDTPGHAAFSALRQRGANGADLVILVVAADDGVMEQTRESIRMIKEANVPMVVAINKIDKGGADIERSKKMLLQEGIQLEEFGGDVQCVPISAAKGTNLNLLVEAVLLQAELLHLRSENKGPIEGVVLESRIDVGRGKLCTALVQRGALRKGAYLVAGSTWAKVRSMFDENGKVLLHALPSTPVEVIGWRDLPSAGDYIYEVESEKLAKLVIDSRLAAQAEEKLKSDAIAIDEKHQAHLKEYKALLEERRRLGRVRLKRKGPREKEIQDDGTIRHSVVIKADVDGSLEALLDVLDTYDCDSQCRLDVVHYGVGDITETDVKLAESFQATIYGFNVKISDKMKALCKSSKLEFRICNVIYRLIDSMKADIGKKLPPSSEPEDLGEANVLAIFKVNEGKRKLYVAGSRCTKGILKKDAYFRVIRENDILFEGKVHSMRHLKNEVDSIKSGVECGLSFSDDLFEPREGDLVKCYTFKDVPQNSDWCPGF